MGLVDAQRRMGNQPFQPDDGLAPEVSVGGGGGVGSRTGRSEPLPPTYVRGKTKVYLLAKEESKRAKKRARGLGLGLEAG